MSDNHQSTMKAVVWEGKPFHMAVKDVPKPEIQSPTDAIVRITTAAICGTDLHTYHGIYGGSDVPYVMGHEAIGIICEVGDRVGTYKVGDRVIIPDGAQISKTEIYAPGQGNLFAPDIGGLQGTNGSLRTCVMRSMVLTCNIQLEAEYARVPGADTALIPVPSGPENELDYLLCSDIFATAWSSITSTGFQPGDTVAVYGAGPVGLLAAYSALLRGATRVYSIDHVPERLARAKSIGAIPIDLTASDPADQILALEPQGPGVKRTSDCVGFECVNTKLEPQENFIINNAIKVTARGGGIALTGVYYTGPANAGEPNQNPRLGKATFDVAAVWLKNLTIASGPVSAGSQEPALTDLVSSGRARPSFVVDKIVKIEDAPEAYRLFDQHKVLKVAIRFGNHE